MQGTQHKRKAEQFFQQYQYRQRKKTLNDSRSPDTSISHAYLGDLRGRIPLVGLQYVEEYTSNDKGDPPLYICILQDCKTDNCVSLVVYDGIKDSFIETNFNAADLMFK